MIRVATKDTTSSDSSSGPSIYLKGNALTVEQRHRILGSGNIVDSTSSEMMIR